MNNRILWIDDDYYAIKGLVRPLVKIGYQIDVATTAKEAYLKISSNEKYNLIIVDIIIPLSDEDYDDPALENWENETFIGIGLIKWILTLGLNTPVIALSVISNGGTFHKFIPNDSVHFISKRGLLPSKFKDDVFRILGLED